MRRSASRCPGLSASAGDSAKRLAVMPTSACGATPRPGDREPVGRQSQLPHEPHVVAVSVVVVTGHVTGVTVDGLVRGVAEGVPDGRRSTVLRGGTFDLVGRGRRAPQEPGWEG